MNVVDCEGIYYKACYTGSDVLDALEQIHPLQTNRKHYQPLTLNKIQKNYKKHRSIQHSNTQKKSEIQLEYAKFQTSYSLQLSKMGLQQLYLHTCE